MKNVHRAVLPILLILTSGSGCAVPTTTIPDSSSMGDGEHVAYYKDLLARMKTPAVKRQADTTGALSPAPFAAEIPSMEGSVPPAFLPLPPKEEQLTAKMLYRIGPEDVIRVSVFENQELTMDVTVRPDGKISLPLINEIHAADLTPMELSDVITQNLKKHMKDPHVAVIVTQSNSLKIFLVGNVLRPGSYPLRKDMSVLQALSLAGGFTTFASPRDMRIISGTGTRKEIRKFNYYKMIENTELRYYMLKPGDTIEIP